MMPRFHDFPIQITRHTYRKLWHERSYYSIHFNDICHDIDATTNQWPFETIRLYALHLCFKPQKFTLPRTIGQIIVTTVAYRHTFIFQARWRGKVHR